MSWSFEVTKRTIRTKQNQLVNNQHQKCTHQRRRNKAERARGEQVEVAFALSDRRIDRALPSYMATLTFWDTISHGKMPNQVLNALSF